MNGLYAAKALPPAAFAPVAMSFERPQMRQTVVEGDTGLAV